MINIYYVKNAVKPNHNLQYDIGTDFCIEDPVNTSFHLTINCPLTQEPLPLPEFWWIINLNGRDLSYEEIVSFGLSVYPGYGTFSLNGTVNTEFDDASMINITCEISNDFGNDTERTSIGLCSKLFLFMPFLSI